MNAAQLKEAAEALASQDVRVLRPSLFAFMLGGGFAKLPITSTTLIDSPYKRQEIADKNGWEIPLDSLGRAVKKAAADFGKDLDKLNAKQRSQVAENVATNSTKESVRLWIAQNLEQFGIAQDMVSICIDD